MSITLLLRLFGAKIEIGLVAQNLSAAPAAPNSAGYKNQLMHDCPKVQWTPYSICDWFLWGRPALWLVSCLWGCLRLFWLAGCMQVSNTVSVFVFSDEMFVMKSCGPAALQLRLFSTKTLPTLTLFTKVTPTPWSITSYPPWSIEQPPDPDPDQAAGLFTPA